MSDGSKTVESVGLEMPSEIYNSIIDDDVVVPGDLGTVMVQEGVQLDASEEEIIHGPPHENPPRAILKIAPDFFLELFRLGVHDGYEVVDNPIPEDAKIVAIANGVGVQIGPYDGMIDLIVESSEFPVTPFGCELPSLVPVIRAVKPSVCA